MKIRIEVKTRIRVRLGVLSISFRQSSLTWKFLLFPQFVPIGFRSKPTNKPELPVDIGEYFKESCTNSPNTTNKGKISPDAICCIIHKITQLFSKMCSPGHSLYHLLPPQRICTKLRSRGHNFLLPDYCSTLHKRSFVIRTLFEFV